MIPALLSMHCGVVVVIVVLFSWRQASCWRDRPAQMTSRRLGSNGCVDDHILHFKMIKIERQLSPPVSPSAEWQHHCLYQGLISVSPSTELE